MTHNFEIGDVVVCIDANDMLHILKHGEKYIIYDVEILDNDTQWNFVRVLLPNGTECFYKWSVDRFRLVDNVPKVPIQ